MLHQYEPPDELDPLYETALREKDRVVYELRRLFKPLEIKYMFYMESPPGSTILCIRNPKSWEGLKESISNRLKEMRYSPHPESIWPHYRDFRPTADPYPFWTCFVETGTTEIYGGKQTLPSVAVGIQLVTNPKSRPII